MSTFVTRAFRFELPGEEWEEASVVQFRPKGDPRRAFAITRQLAHAEQDLVATVLELPSLYEDRRIVRSEHRQIGPLDAQEVRIIARTKVDTDYHRMVSIGHYEQAINFSWVAPAEEREALDARVDAILDNLRFRRR